MGPNSSEHPANSADEPLKGRGEDGDAARLHGSRHEAPATKSPPRQADLTEPARAVTQRRVGSDVIPAGRPQPGSRLGDAPAPGRPSGRRTPPAAPRASPTVGPDWAVSAEALGRRVRRATPGQPRRRRERQREARHGDPLQPEEPR